MWIVNVAYFLKIISIFSILKVHNVAPSVHNHAASLNALNISIVYQMYLDVNKQSECLGSGSSATLAPIDLWACSDCHAAT
eukprot:c44213_g1_i1 orf=1-240(-)